MSNVKNAEAFARLVGLCAGFGETYTPGQQHLQLESLEIVLSNARQALTRIHAIKTYYEDATNQREVIFADLRPLAGRIMGELRASGALPQTIADAHSMVRKITWRKAVDREPVAPADAATPNHSRQNKRRARGLDFASMADHFEKLLQTLMSEPSFHPNVPDLKLPSLRERLETMHNANQTVIQVVTELNKARRERHELFYGHNGSLYKTAQAVKQQVKAIYGYKSDPFRLVRAIRFTKPIG